MNKTYIPALLILILLAVLHYFGNKYYLYVRVSWYDVMMHVLGGAGIAFSAYWFLKTLLRDSFTFSHVWMIVVVTLIVGILWEALESFYNIAGAPVGTLHYYVDSTKDLVNDTLGGLIAYISLKK